MAAWRAKALTADGAVAAAVVGFIVFQWGGFSPALALFVFFATASALTKWSARRREPMGLRGAPKDAPPARRQPGRPPTAPRRAAHRDADGRRAAQVLANGGVAALAVLAGRLWPDPAWAAAYAGAIAAVTADTWATELGVLARRPPVLITTWRPVEPGRSGAVSAVGTLGGVAGAALIAFVSALTWNPPGGAGSPVALALAAWAAGIIGMLIDSVLGATVEERWRWPGGRPACGNDAVNGAASLAGAAAAAWLYTLLAG